MNGETVTKSVPLKAIIEVVAGLVPGTPLPEFTRKWYWTSNDQAALSAPENAPIHKEAHHKWIQIAGESREYAAMLENPQMVNWVRRDWLWL